LPFIYFLGANLVMKLTALSSVSAKLAMGMIGSIAISGAWSASANAATVNLTFTQLTGVTGGTPAGTGVYRADLSSLGFDLASITIADSGSGVGGASGQFSGFDLDAIKLSRTLTNTATSVNGLADLNVFDFNPSGTVFTGGTQRTPVDPKLFGTNVAGNAVNNAVATLGSFDANASTSTPFGFVSLGDGGKVSFNLTSLIASSTPLYLYIGEVGNNGESVAGTITVSDNRIPTPALLPGLIGLGTAAWRKRRNAATAEA
jgi:hypothetical protein